MKMKPQNQAQFSPLSQNDERNGFFCYFHTHLVPAAQSIPIPKISNVRVFSQLGLAPSSHRTALKQPGTSVFRYSLKTGRKGKHKRKGVYASLFGIGAPEALIIGVVALLVFGPKGLAEVARTFGKTLRSFQPTIKELQEVSRDFKSSLEREIGLDEIDSRTPKNFISKNPMPVDTPEDLRENVESNKSSADGDSSPSASGAYTADEYLKVTEAQLEGALARLQKEEKEKAANQSGSQVQPQPQVLDTPQEVASVVPPTPSPKPETEI